MYEHSIAKRNKMHSYKRNQVIGLLLIISLVFFILLLIHFLLAVLTYKYATSFWFGGALTILFLGCALLILQE